MRNVHALSYVRYSGGNFPVGEESAPGLYIAQGNGFKIMQCGVVLVLYP